MSGDPPFSVLSLDQAEAVPILDGAIDWIPVRLPLGIRAFGCNAYRGDAGREIVERHSESSGHEEIYVVLRGRASFEIGGETVAARAGSVVFMRDPDVERHAIAEEDGTLVLAVGGWPDKAFSPSPWEPIFLTHPLVADGDFAGAARLIEERATPEQLGSAAVQYTLATHKARAGDPEAAITHLVKAYELKPERVPAWAARDAAVLEPLRGDPRFPKQL